MAEEVISGNEITKAADAEEEELDHLGLRVEDVQKSSEEQGGIANLLRMMSDDPAAGDALAESEDGKIIERRLFVMAVPEDSPEEISRWEKFEKGLHKEVHEEGLEKWSSFVPMAAFKDPSRRFPLIFALHGAHNPIQMVESYGIIQVAAREECIVICPENENWSSIDRLFAIAKENYPVDFSRVYAMGYSFGGFSSSRAGLAHPERFAGIGMGGMLFANNVKGHDLDGQWYEEYLLTEDMLKKAEQLELPIALVMGEHEMLGLLPVTAEPSEETANGVIPLRAADKKVSFNNFRRAAGCKPADFVTREEAANETEAMTGIRFEEAGTRIFNGRKYNFGFSRKADGECLFVTVAVEGMVHWPSSMFGEILWTHLSRYARNTETGELIRLK